MRSGSVEEGALLRVPFGKKEVLAVVWRVVASDSVSRQPYRLKSLMPCMRQDLPPLCADFRAFIQTLAAYTMTPRGRVLKSVFSPLLNAGSLPRKKERLAYRITEKGREKHRTEKTKDKKTQSQRLLAMLEQRSSSEPSSESLSREALLSEGISASVLRSQRAQGFIEQGFVDEVRLSAQSPHPPSPPLSSPPLDIMARKLPLDEQQQQAAQELCALYKDNKFATVLLDGETGSGKTEVYFEAIAACLQAGKQVLLMLPEIALSVRFAERFRERFGIKPLLCHSALSARERRAAWHEVAQGTACAVLGARSALFLPFCNLGLVVVDEEHDHAYKQEEGIVYHARDMAVLRAQKANCLAVLVSATPSLESWHNAERGKYQRILLPNRFGAARMPKVTIVDLLQEPRDTKTSDPFLTPTLCARHRRNLVAQGASADLSQSPRLRAFVALRSLWCAALLPLLQRLAGRTSRPRTPRLPPLRLFHADAHTLPFLRR